jgi:uncharacterized protein (TIGR02246 family)
MPGNDQPLAAAEALVRRLEAAWNSADATAFAACFAEDADFVNVNGLHAQGREAIARGHDEIFNGIYAGSDVSYAVEQVRALRGDVALLHAHAAHNVPAGPLAGSHEARWSAVLVRDGAGWEIAAFQNTLVKDANARVGDAGVAYMDRAGD